MCERMCVGGGNGYGVVWRISIDMVTPVARKGGRGGGGYGNPSLSPSGAVLATSSAVHIVAPPLMPVKIPSTLARSLAA